MSALVYAAMAAVRAKQGRVDEAKRDLRQGIELMALLGDFLAWYGAQASLLLAHAALWLADIVGARTLLAQASRLARKVPDAVIFERWFTEAWAHMDTLAETSLAGPSSLTIAELRVLRFLPSYRSFREIAELLGVSANTVKSQAHAVYRKLGAASRSEAVARALGGRTARPIGTAATGPRRRPLPHVKAEREGQTRRGADSLCAARDEGDRDQRRHNLLIIDTRGRRKVDRPTQRCRRGVDRKQGAETDERLGVSSQEPLTQRLSATAAGDRS